MIETRRDRAHLFDPVVVAGLTVCRWCQQLRDDARHVTSHSYEAAPHVLGCSVCGGGYYEAQHTDDDA